jgi:hypothetical protein
LKRHILEKQVHKLKEKFQWFHSTFLKDQKIHITIFQNTFVNSYFQINFKTPTLKIRLKNLQIYTTFLRWYYPINYFRKLKKSRISIRVEKWWWNIRFIWTRG